MTDDTPAAAAPPPADAEVGGDLGLTRTIEALLFVADRALDVAELAEVTEAPARDVADAIRSLQSTYAERGIVLINHRDSYRLVSAPDLAAFCRRLLGMESRTRLSRAALETLGVIAYRQPVTRAEIEHIRGVDSDSPLATLLARSLIEESGRLNAPGRPAQFGTTDTFLAYFGIPSLDALPDIDIPEPARPPMDDAQPASSADEAPPPTGVQQIEPGA